MNDFSESQITEAISVARRGIANAHARTIYPPLKLSDWLSRDLPSPDLIMGTWLSTTSRVLLFAATGLGKTNFGMSLGLHASAGVEFLHWRGRRACTVLYIDGEMSRRLLRQRMQDAVGRLGMRPERFHALSHEDVQGFASLNTSAGQEYIDGLIAHIGPVDLIIFDSIMCLLLGDMKEGEPWSQVMPWVRKLTSQSIGQIWIHHTGHDETRSYGDKTKEWQLDTVLHMEAAAHPGADIAFNLQFRKARERTPANKADFEPAKVALIGDRWTVEATGVVKPGNVSPLGLKFLIGLQNAIAGDSAEQRYGQRAVQIEHWRSECVKLGLLEPGAPPPPRNRFSPSIAAN